jgi:hypothetical protein
MCRLISHRFFRVLLSISPRPHPARHTTTHTQCVTHPSARTHTHTLHSCTRLLDVYLRAEPTNHLDIPSKEMLEEAVRAFEGSVIAVSHDRYFLRRIATRILQVRHECLGWDVGWLAVRFASCLLLTGYTNNTRGTKAPPPPPPHFTANLPNQGMHLSFYSFSRGYRT